MRHIIIIAHNIRSTHNIGSIFRTCDGFGVEKIILSGYSPYPATEHDTRLPHLRDKVTAQIHKTALGAENSVPFEVVTDIDFTALQHEGYRIIGLEQHPRSQPLHTYQPPDKIVLLLGEEVDGIDSSLISMCDDIVEIPMYGSKESFNVSVSAGIALYHLRMA